MAAGLPTAAVGLVAAVGAAPHGVHAIDVGAAAALADYSVLGCRWRRDAEARVIDGRRRLERL